MPLRLDPYTASAIPALALLLCVLSAPVVVAILVWEGLGPYAGVALSCGAIAVAAVGAWFLLRRLVSGRGRTILAGALSLVGVGLAGTTLATGLYDDEVIVRSGGPNVAAMLYERTGLAYGDYRKRLLHRTRDWIGMAPKCLELFQGKANDAFVERHCRDMFTDLDQRMVDDLAAAKEGTLAERQSAIERAYGMPFLDDVDPLAPGSFEGWWTSAGAARSCERAVERDGRLGLMEAVVLCAGTHPDVVWIACEGTADRANEFAAIREACPAGRPADRERLLEIARSNVSRCNLSRCVDGQFPDIDMDKPEDRRKVETIDVPAPSILQAKG